MANPEIRASLKATVEELRARYEYDPETGIVRTRVATNAKPAGYIIAPHRNVRYNYEKIATSRLAWLLYHGEWPKLLVDHKNRDRTDNSLKNLRLATHQENQRNKVMPNKHGLKGIVLRKGRWAAYIRADRKQVYLGSFDTKEAAHIAYAIAAKKYHKEFAQLETQKEIV